ncbi:hypothetical protein BgiMline_030871 [Biomphalaria glabrata]
METPIEPLLPAFHILWKTAFSDYRRNGPYNPDFQKFASPLQQLHFSRGLPQRVEHDLNENESGNVQGISSIDETVVVCTLDCDNGDRFLRQIIYESSNKTEWARAEDHFVDWLNCELTSQHSQKVEATIYMCYLPIDTTSHGIGLWLKNLQTEGKEIKVTIKVASLTDIVSSTDENQKASVSYHRCQHNDVIKALRKLTSRNVHIEAITSKDWTHLMKLLTDRTSLQALDKNQHHATEVLNSILQTDHHN